MNTRTFRALLALAGLLPLAPSAFAAEAFDNCTGFIDTLPATISTQGTWCLRKDLATGMTSGNAITVTASNVTIDCNGYKVGGLAGGIGTLAAGVAMGKSNAAIRNCNIRGFYIGIQVIGAAPLIEDNRIDGSTNIGIDVSGEGGTVRRNMVSTSGGSTIWPEGYGIHALKDTDILDNTIDTVVPRAGGNGNGYGIFLQDSTGATVAGNRIRNVTSDGTGAAYGFFGQAISRVTISDNQVIGLDSGTAISCTDAGSAAVGNTIAGFQTAIATCDNVAGSNLVTN